MTFKVYGTITNILDIGKGSLNGVENTAGKTILLQLMDLMPPQRRRQTLGKFRCPGIRVFE